MRQSRQGLTEMTKTERKKVFDCWRCEYRREVPGSAHIACVHPSIGERPATEKLVAMFASVGRAPPIVGTTAELNIQGDPHGIRYGWFNWPHNFDPLWLQNCNGYKEASQDASE